MKHHDAFHYHCSVTPRAIYIAVVYLCIPILLFGQSGRHDGSKSGNTQGTSTPPADNPDVTDFKRAVAIEATDEQQTKFQLLAKYTEAARQRAQALQRAALDAAVKHATALQGSLDEVQGQDRDFLKTLSDAQASGLKKQAKKLSQSDANVGKEAKKLSAELERIPPDPQRLQQTAVHIEQALATLQADQNGLGKQMGTAAH